MPPSETKRAPKLKPNKVKDLVKTLEKEVEDDLEDVDGEFLTLKANKESQQLRRNLNTCREYLTRAKNLRESIRDLLDDPNLSESVRTKLKSKADSLRRETIGELRIYVEMHKDALRDLKEEEKAKAERRAERTKRKSAIAPSPPRSDDDDDDDDVVFRRNVSTPGKKRSSESAAAATERRDESAVDTDDEGGVFSDITSVSQLMAPPPPPRRSRDRPSSSSKANSGSKYKRVQNDEMRRHQAAMEKINKPLKSFGEGMQKGFVRESDDDDAASIVPPAPRGRRRDVHSYDKVVFGGLSSQEESGSTALSARPNDKSTERWEDLMRNAAPPSDAASVASSAFASLAPPLDREAFLRGHDERYQRIFNGTSSGESGSSTVVGGASRPISTNVPPHRRSASFDANRSLADEVYGRRRGSASRPDAPSAARVGVVNRRLATASDVPQGGRPNMSTIFDQIRNRRVSGYATSGPLDDRLRTIGHNLSRLQFSVGLASTA